MYEKWLALVSCAIDGLEKVDFSHKHNKGVRLPGGAKAAEGLLTTMNSDNENTTNVVVGPSTNLADFRGPLEQKRDIIRALGKPQTMIFKLDTDGLLSGLKKVHPQARGVEDAAHVMRRPLSIALLENRRNSMIALHAAVRDHQ